MMDWLLGVNWAEVFSVDTPLLEIFVRGTITYLGVILLVRVTISRQAGNIASTDLLVLVLLADAAQNAMADDYHSVTDGLLLVATIVGWSYALDWLGYHFSLVERLIHPPAVTLVREGRLVRSGLKQELITEEELFDHLRAHGVEDLSQVKAARLEGSGQISVIKRGEVRPRNSGRRQQD